MTKIILLGKQGQIARRLYPALLSLGEIVVCSHHELDLRDTNQIQSCIRRHKPDIVINAMAYTHVDQAEQTQRDAFLINTEAVKTLVNEANLLNSWFIHFSSDYVFDGLKKTPYTEEDKMNPINIYGQSKALADTYIQSTAQRYVILRTSWVYDVFGMNFPKVILNLAKHRNCLKVVNDVFGIPNSAIFIANMTALMIYRILTALDPLSFIGLYHLSHVDTVSRFDFARFLVECAQTIGSFAATDVPRLEPIASCDYPMPAKRPAYSALNISKWEKTMGIQMPSWKTSIPPFVEEMKLMGQL